MKKMKKTKHQIAREELELLVSKASPFEDSDDDDVDAANEYLSHYIDLFEELGGADIKEFIEDRYYIQVYSPSGLAYEHIGFCGDCKSWSKFSFHNKLSGIIVKCNSCNTERVAADE